MSQKSPQTPDPRKIIPIHIAPQAPCCAPPSDADHGHEEGHIDACCGPATQAAQVVSASVAPTEAPVDAAKVRYRIEQMDCPTEERLIRNKLEPMPGIVRLDFNLIGRELTVYHRLSDPQPVEEALTAVGMAPRLLEAGQRPTALPPALPMRARLWLGVSGVAAVAAEASAWITGNEHHPLGALLAVVAILTSGLPTLKKGWIALRHFTLNIYFLMTLAVGGALLIGRWSEAAMVVFLFALAEAIEALSLERARHAIQSLSALAPDTAHVWLGSTWVSQPVEQVNTGARIRVRAGERVPLDARITQGQAALNEAPITGESLPVDKQVGDSLYAGTIVTNGVLEATVTAAANDSTLARVARAIQEAQSQRAPTQRFVDQFARYYTPIVVLLALATALLGPMFSSQGWLHWVYQALVMLVIACPCALVVSTPVTVVSGLAAAARRGILVKGGAHLEGGRLLKAIALDKTGTLTHGKPALTLVRSLGALSDTEALRLAASLDHHSAHPVAQAVVQAWQARADGQPPLSEVTGFHSLHGLGVRGDIALQTWHLGNHRLLEDLGLCSPELEAQLAQIEQTGQTALILSNSTGPQALLAVSDTLRPESIEAVRQLKALGIHPVMLSGDNALAARHVAQQAGIDDARGNLLPEDKLKAIEDLIREHGHVGMVGDGVNDGPALARAHIGLAMGAAGTATALEAADVAIMDDDPRKIGTFVRLSHLTAAVLKQNIALALGIKIVFFALALTGHATLWMAVFADMGASLIVVFNGLRLLRFKD